MKKTLSYILTAVIVLTSVFCIPFSSQAATYEPDRTIYAEAYMLINLDDDSYPVVAQKNIDERLYPASLTKIVTAMVVINNVKDFQAKTKMSQSAFDATLGTGAQVAGIEVGQELTIDELLYLTMVHSACDACQILAEYVSGDSNTFVAEMNKYVQSLGCKDTHFVNCDGLHSDDHYTTARDMATITLDALKNQNFVKYSTAKEVKFGNLVLGHTNLMLSPGYVTYYYEYAQGIKTGSTEQAEYCLVTKATKDGYNYLAVVLKSPRQKINGQSYETKCSFVDAKSLFEWAFDSLKYSTLVKQNELLNEITVEDGKDADSVQLVAKEDVNVIVPSGLDKSGIIIEPVEKPELLKAPVTKGQEVCKANIIYGGDVIAQTDLVAAEDVELSTFLKVINAIKSFFATTAVKIILIIFVAAVLVYVFMVINNQNKKKKRRAKKQIDSQKSNNNPDDFLPPPQRRN